MGPFPRPSLSPPFGFGHGQPPRRAAGPVVHPGLIPSRRAYTILVYTTTRSESTGRDYFHSPLGCASAVESVRGCIILHRGRSLQQSRSDPSATPTASWEEIEGRLLPHHFAHFDENPANPSQSSNHKKKYPRKRRPAGSFPKESTGIHHLIAAIARQTAAIARQNATSGPPSAAWRRGLRRRRPAPRSP
jgi:hypothetical protein